MSVSQTERHKYQNYGSEPHKTGSFGNRIFLTLKNYKEKLKYFDIWKTRFSIYSIVIVTVFF
jgi:hypothetical protein